MLALGSGRKVDTVEEALDEGMWHLMGMQDILEEPLVISGCIGLRHQEGFG
jgi:hypothetical protein